jgi:hypothetical protein
MAPKHGLSQTGATEGQHAKRAKSSNSPESPASRSATPVDPVDSSSKVPFEVHYPAMTSSNKKKLSKNKLELNEELAKVAEFQVSPFLAKGAAKDGELDQHYTVTPTKEWEAMKKYNNFISEHITGYRLIR